MWLWSSAIGATVSDVDRCWQSFLRRFDLEHTFRLVKQTLGWTVPRIRTPQAADRWTWLVSAPNPSRPGPGRPPGSKNATPATRHDVGKPPRVTEP
jgi:hypothetical protein